jgi:hypothetical protein
MVAMNPGFGSILRTPHCDEVVDGPLMSCGARALPDFFRMFIIFNSIQFISHPWIIIHDIGQVQISIIL